MSKRGLKFYSYESYELLKPIKQKLHLWRTCFQALTLVSMISFKYQKTLQMKCLGWFSGTLTQRFTCKDFFWGEKRFTINTCGEVKATGLGRDRWRQRVMQTQERPQPIQRSSGVILNSTWPGHYAFDSDTACPQGVGMTLGQAALFCWGQFHSQQLREWRLIQKREEDSIHRIHYATTHAPEMRNSNWETLSNYPQVRWEAGIEPPTSKTPFLMPCCLPKPVSTEDTCFREG